TTCINDASPASNKQPYKFGEGKKNFYVLPDSTDYNQYARCSECFTQALQAIIYFFLFLIFTIHLYDLNNFSLNEHLLKSHHAFANNRYGDLTFCEQIEDDYNNQSHALFLV
ncbi:unnamed protein product, partial [Rotaria sp. Silwood1]